MELIWEHGQLSALQVTGFLRIRRDVAKTTVRTLMERMEQKGWLRHSEVGRTYVYRAARAKQKTLRAAVAEVVDRLCKGKPELLVTALLDEKNLSIAEIDRIRALLNREKAKRHKNSTEEDNA